MIMKQRLDQRQVQKLILAPALQQAIKLLPLTNLELIEVIDQELAENPMLEFEGETEEGKAEPSGESPAAEAPAADGAAAETAAEDPSDAEFESYFQEYFDDGFRSPTPERKDVPSLENTLSSPPSLWDHLGWQANLTFFDSAGPGHRGARDRQHQRGRLLGVIGRGDRGGGRGDAREPSRPSGPRSGCSTPSASAA